MEFSVDKKGTKQSIRQKGRKERVWEAGKLTSMDGFHHSPKRISPRCVCVCDAETKGLEECVSVKREENMTAFSSQTACWRFHAAQTALMPLSAVPVGEREQNSEL